MQIPKKQLDDSINGIVDYFHRTLMNATTKEDYQKIQDTSVSNLDGIYFLFLENLDIGRQITQAKIKILDDKYLPKKIINELHHDIECLNEHCLGECITPTSQDIENIANQCETISKSGVACLPPDQTSEVVGQGGSNFRYIKTYQKTDISPGYNITCSECNGNAIDQLDIYACDNCHGTCKEFIATNNHATICRCLECLPYGPGEEVILKIQQTRAVII